MSTYVSDANFVVLMVLLAAAMQAAWNISVKSSPYLTLTEINVTVGMVAIPLLLVSGLPDQRAFLWIGLGVVIRQAYYVTLSFAYKHNDFGLVYPLVRGLNPVLITVLGVVFLDETL